MLADNPWDGGKGMSLADIGRLTLDQVFMMLVDRKNMQKGSKMTVSAAKGLVGKDGFIRGWSADGKPIKGVIAGKSLARQIIERKLREKNLAKRMKKEAEQALITGPRRRRR